MEGGYFPWKNQSTEVVDELDVLGRPLPSPPAGSIWVRESDGNWLLTKLDQVSDSFSNTESDPDVIEHVVQADDTLQGVSLKYGVSIMEIKRVNVFSGNSIQYMKTLRIPLIKGVLVTSQERNKSEEVIIRRFCDETKESLAESRIYLEDNNWDLDAAVGAWRRDEHWTNTQSSHSSGREDADRESYVKAGEKRSKKLD